MGQCPATSDKNDTCTVGGYEDISGDPDDKWWCRGNHPTNAFTNDDVQCAPVIDGECGPTTDICFAGTFSGLPDAQWECIGINGGTDDTCPPSNNADIGCGTLVNTCTPGIGSFSLTGQGHDGSCSTWGSIILDSLHDTSDLYRWRCRVSGVGYCGGRSHGYSASFDCEIPAVGPSNGVCGTADNAVQGCTDGIYQDETGDGWTCQGTGGGADASCGQSFCDPLDPDSGVNFWGPLHRQMAVRLRLAAAVVIRCPFQMYRHQSVYVYLAHLSM